MEVIPLHLAISLFQIIRSGISDTCFPIFTFNKQQSQGSITFFAEILNIKKNFISLRYILKRELLRISVRAAWGNSLFIFEFLWFPLRLYVYLTLKTNCIFSYPLFFMYYFLCSCIVSHVSSRLIFYFLPLQKLFINSLLLVFLSYYFSETH